MLIVDLWLKVLGLLSVRISFKKEKLPTRKDSNESDT